jgi:hypothetical protein
MLAGIGVVVLVSLCHHRGFDRGALLDDFDAGRADAALARLARAPAADLPPALTAFSWWSKEQRAPALARLLATPEADLLESPSLPTLVAPLDRFREQPSAARLREAWDQPLIFELTHLDTTLLAMKAPVPPGTTEIPLDAGLLPGADYQMALREVDASGGDGPIVALARFHWDSAEQAQAAGLAMATAHDLAASSHLGSSLLTAIAALDLGYTEEAIDRLAELELGEPTVAQLARELRAQALTEQGLDWSARRLLIAR